MSDDKKPKKHRINFNVNQDEYEELKRRQKESGIKNLSAFCRVELLYGNVENHVDRMEICNELEIIRSTVGGSSMPDGSKETIYSSLNYIYAAAGRMGGWQNVHTEDR